MAVTLILLLLVFDTCMTVHLWHVTSAQGKTIGGLGGHVQAMADELACHDQVIERVMGGQDE